MHTPPQPPLAVSERFFQPLSRALELPLAALRSCCKLPDADWLRIGVLRAVHEMPSGRALLQHLRDLGSLPAPSLSHFFESLKSSRRLALCAQVNASVAQSLRFEVRDPLGACCPALAPFDVYAADGHYHSSATHDLTRDRDGAKLPSGHFMRLNLRTHAMEHLCAADTSAGRKREHDMRALKRLGSATLRGPAPKGRKVLYVYDRACIDFRQWYNWKHSAGIYFITRSKENLALEILAELPFERQGALNAGVRADQMVGSAGGVQLRRVIYHDALRDETFEFITNEFELAPGIIAHLHKMRWDIEKVFDQFKSKLGERKAWASSAQAKSQQGQFLCLAHNLMVLMEAHLEREAGIRNEAELRRRAARLAAESARYEEQKRQMPELARGIQRLTQRSVKFIRWLRYQLFAPTSYSHALARLRDEYAQL